MEKRRKKFPIWLKLFLKEAYAKRRGEAREKLLKVEFENKHIPSLFFTSLCLYKKPRVFKKKQAARAWSHSVRESQWGAGKNEFMAKVFLQKITRKLLSPSPPLLGYGQNSENVICN